MVIAAMTFLAVSCGPSASEIRAKQVADSTKVADSIALVQAQKQKIADSLTKVAEAAKADSTAKAAKAPKAKISKKTVKAVKK